MAKPKKQKAKAAAADDPVNVHAEPSNMPSAAHATHDVTMNNPALSDGGGYGDGDWGAPGHVAVNDSGGGWGVGGSVGSAGTAGDAWGEPSPAGDEWGAPAGGDWGAPPAAAHDSWGGQASPASMHGASLNGGGYGAKKSSLKKGGAHSHLQQSVPQPAQAPAPTSFHPSAAAHAAPMPSSRYGAHHEPQDWGAPAATGWGDQGAWGPPAPPKPPPAPPAAKPAWANWVNEAKGMPMAQAQAQASHQPGRGQHARAQSLHPSQQWQDPHFVAEQQSILRSIQETRPQPGSHHPQYGRPQPVQQADSWGHMGGGGWGERASTIPEEDEYDDDEEDDWGDGMGHDKGGYGWGGGQQSNGGRVRFSPNISYSNSPRQRSQSAPSLRGMGAQPQPHPQGNAQQFWAPSPMASKTMKIATGAISTTVFELPPPRNGMGEAGFVDSQGAALVSAQRAMFSRDRPAKERFRWGFNPDKDPRVRSLLQWIATMSNGLATIGLKRFLETGEKGALFANADFRVPSPVPGAPAQPTFDYVTLDQIQKTLDATLQESVRFYDPAFQVIVFVFLLSPSGNSMALWRRKLNVPDSVREEYHEDILAVKAELKNYPVYVDELPVQPAEAPPKKKKVRFAFLRRLFGGKKSATAS